MQDRLQQVLTLLGYEQATQPHYRSNLVHAIALFAGAHGDTELEQACEDEISRIRSDIASSKADTETR